MEWCYVKLLIKWGTPKIKIGFTWGWKFHPRERSGAKFDSEISHDGDFGIHLLQTKKHVVRACWLGNSQVERKNPFSETPQTLGCQAVPFGMAVLAEPRIWRFNCWSHEKKKGRIQSIIILVVWWGIGMDSYNIPIQLGNRILYIPYATTFFFIAQVHVKLENTKKRSAEILHWISPI